MEKKNTKGKRERRKYRMSMNSIHKYVEFIIKSLEIEREREIVGKRIVDITTFKKSKKICYRADSVE